MLIGHGAAHLSDWHFAGVTDASGKAATFTPSASRERVPRKYPSAQKERDEHGRD
jgi:hypothetical protein